MLVVVGVALIRKLLETDKMAVVMESITTLLVVVGLATQAAVVAVEGMLLAQEVLAATAVLAWSSLKSRHP